MSFSDLSFLFRFFPIFMIVYGVSPPKWRRYTIVLFSFAFAAFSSVWAVPLLGAPVMVNYFLGRFVRRSKWVLYAGVGLDVAFLAACRLIPLPLPGVSYLMFSLISYLVDVSRETVVPARGRPVHRLRHPVSENGHRSHHPRRRYSSPVGTAQMHAGAGREGGRAADPRPWL